MTSKEFKSVIKSTKTSIEGKYGCNLEGLMNICIEYGEKKVLENQKIFEHLQDDDEVEPQKTRQMKYNFNYIVITPKTMVVEIFETIDAMKDMFGSKISTIKQKVRKGYCFVDGYLIVRSIEGQNGNN